MKEYAAHYTTFRNTCLLATMMLLIMDAKYFLLTKESLFPLHDSEDRIIHSIRTSAYLRSKNKTKPLLVLHVGPGFTDTGSIQATLAKDWSEEFLRSDHYKYIGNNADILKVSKSYRCKGEVTEGCTRTLSPQLMDLLEKEDQNLVGSNRVLGTLDDDKRQAWVDATTNKWDVKIVVDYVRLHELLPNRYNQAYEKETFGHHNWPGIKGSYKIPSFSEYLAEHVDWNEHETLQIREAWGKDFAVSTFNVHQEGDLTANFVCQAIPGADHMCQRLTNDGSEPKKGRSKGSAFIPDYDRMAVQAYEQGLVHEADNRYELAQAIQEHHKKGKEELPRACPDKETLDQVYDASLKFESWALELGASKPVTDFNAHWDTILKQKKLCGVDAAAAVEQEVWRSFLRLRYVRKADQAFYG